MIQIILCIVGVFYFLKRPRLAGLRAEDFPTVPSAPFAEWKRLELASIDTFLLATWGTAAFGTFIGLAMSSAGPVPAGVAVGIFAAGFLAGLTVSAIQGSKAARLRKTFGIHWS